MRSGRGCARKMGERAVLLFQNLHRYTFYASLLLLVFLWEDSLRSSRTAASASVLARS